MKISPEARAAYEAFEAKRSGIKAQFEAEAASRVSAADPTPARPVVADQKAALSALTETGARLTEDFQKARESFRASDRAKALAEARPESGKDKADRFGAEPAREDGPLAKRSERPFGPGKDDDADRFAGVRNRPDAFGPDSGADRLRTATAIRAYERAGASFARAAESGAGL